MPRGVAVVTDSTAYLPADLIARHGIDIVPLHVAVGGSAGREGIEVTPVEVASALHERRYAVTTSRPAPEELAAAYRRAFDAGASGVVSVHLSATLSGTFEAASLAAADASGPVAVVDSRSTAMGLGFAVLAAAGAAEAGAELDAVRTAAESTAARTVTLFYVDTLEHLRRGGRIGAASALVGTTLAVKPILHVDGGRIVVKEKVRTASRGMARLEDLAVEAAGDRGCDLAVHHLAAADRAEGLRDRLVARLPGLGRVMVVEVGAVVGAHAGPGLGGVGVVPRA
ncbi:MAG TPA: DegV family protein [Cryptosporangiaceae bacterium]|nr:DegV family protein [Cryptosporangiaceae bacterium]